MILAAHVILTAYGFWLSNDPRGSWSDFIRQWELLKYGPATKTDERRSVAGRAHDSALRAAAKKDLMYEPVIFTGQQALAIANGFGDVVRRTCCIILACAIMPDHVHLVIARHHYEIQKLANLLKGGATTRLRREGIDPFSGCLQGRSKPSPWAHKFWKVWLDSPEDVVRAIEYTNDNPTKAGLKPQSWRFVRPYTG
jgi:REP element-mobilizing transposase RayT